MMKNVYGGYVECGGKFKDSDKEWTNYNILVADYRPGGKPVKAKVLKAASSLKDTLSTLPIGCVVELTFDFYQRVIGINVCKGV